MTKYAVGIPTRGREEILWTTLRAFIGQTVPPKLIIVIDNNDKQDRLFLPDNVILTDKTRTIIVQNDHETLGDSQAAQTALRHFTELGYKIGVRWDDDLVPEPDCMERIVEHIKYGYRGSGGMYPSNNITYPNPKMAGLRATGFSYIDENKNIHSGNEHKRHVQFFRWKGEDIVLRRHYLYSSFAYNVQKANLIGGFATDYSRHCFRADTDFTLRLGMVGQLVVDTAAVAVHHWGIGGTRLIEGDEKDRMREHDLMLFDKRMIACGINPNF